MNTYPAAINQRLTEIIDTELDTPISIASTAISDALRAQYGDSVLGIVYYGSCFRTGTERDGILDIFVIVDQYSTVYSNRILRAANQVLPPNVFYYEMEFEGSTLRTKYAVMTLKQFVHRTSNRCFHTFFWARFAQPCAVTYVRDPSTRGEIVNALAGAIGTFVNSVLPLLPPRFDAQVLWTTGLSASYGTELRPEAGGAAASLVQKNLERYRTVTDRLLDDEQGFFKLFGKQEPSQYLASISVSRRCFGRLAWRLRRVQGKLINLLRIMKAAFTFDGGVDYVLWKIERHSGIKVEATPLLRRHPLLTCWPTVWRLYRAGAFK
jgi:hypothetical protein